MSLYQYLVSCPERSMNEVQKIQNMMHPDEEQIYPWAWRVVSREGAQSVNFCTAGTSISASDYRIAPMRGEQDLFVVRITDAAYRTEIARIRRRRAPLWWLLSWYGLALLMGLPFVIQAAMSPASGWTPQSAMVFTTTVTILIGFPLLTFGWLSIRFRREFDHLRGFHHASVAG